MSRPFLFVVRFSSLFLEGLKRFQEKPGFHAAIQTIISAEKIIANRQETNQASKGGGTPCSGPRVVAGATDGEDGTQGIVATTRQVYAIIAPQNAVSLQDRRKDHCK